MSEINNKYKASLLMQIPYNINYSIKSRYGFTLAEVLITLGIIGILAAITIPVLINAIQENQYKTAYKKAYSVLSQALLKAYYDNTLTPINGTAGGEVEFPVIQNEFSVSKACDWQHRTECWDSSGELYRAETGSTNAVPSFIDKSGMAWRLRAVDAAMLTQNILVDTNGSKPPNKYGQDRFPFGFVVDSNNMPIKITVGADVNSASDSIAKTICPSWATHPCYYTTWLYN